MVIREGTVDFDRAETWCRVTGELRPGEAEAPAPLVVLHGGPRATHDYLLSLADLGDSRAVVHYDHLGNGRSTPGIGWERSKSRRCSSRAATTRRHRRCSRFCSTGSAARSGSASRSRPTCRMSRRASSTCRTSRFGSPARRRIVGSILLS